MGRCENTHVQTRFIHLVLSSPLSSPLFPLPLRRSLPISLFSLSFISLFISHALPISVSLSIYIYIYIYVFISSDFVFHRLFSCDQTTHNQNTYSPTILVCSPGVCFVE